MVQEDTEEVLDERSIREGLNKLAALCKVLDLDYKEKLDVIGDLGAGVDQGKRMDRFKSLQEILSLLDRTKEDRFTELLDLGVNLVEEWKSSDQPVTKMLKYAQVFAMFEAEGSEDVTDAKALSKSLLTKVSDEIDNLKFVKNNKVTSKYLSKKHKLVKLLSDSHTVLDPSVFDPNKEVAPTDLHAETKAIKRLIKQVKPQVLLRREVVLRMSLLEKMAAKPPVPLSKIDGMIKVIQDLAGIVESSMAMTYDGFPINQVLERHRKASQAVPATSQKKKQQEESGVGYTSQRMTRSGSRLGPSNPLDFTHPKQRRSNITGPAPPPPARSSVPAPPSSAGSAPAPSAALAPLSSAGSPAPSSLLAPPCSTATPTTRTDV